MIPPVEVSTRKLETSPSVRYMPSLEAENGRAVAGAISSVANGLDRILEVKRRADEREAEYSVMQADNFVRNGWLGYDNRDPQTGTWTHTPGVADRNWEQMRDDKTTSLDEMRKLQDAVRKQDFYTNLSAEQKKVFERKWIFKANQHTRSAQEHGQRLAQARIVDETNRMVAMRGEEVARMYGADNETYARTAGRNALLNFGDLQGTALNERSRAMLDDPRCTFADIAKSQGWDERTTSIKFDQYKKLVTAYDIDRISAFQKAAATGQRLGAYNADQCADMADQCVDSLKKIGNISDAQANAIKAETAKARKKTEALRIEANKNEYNECLAQIGEIELDLCNPKKVAQTGNGLNYEAFCTDLEKNHPNLSHDQSVALRKQYRQLCDYYTKYTADLAKYTKKTADAENKQNSENGYFRDDGVFIPASAFPKDSDSTSIDEFGKTSAVWQDPQRGLARLEAARMTGRLSETDYKNYRSYGEMLMDKDAQKWWFENYGKFNLEGLIESEYGNDDPGRSLRKKREKEQYTAASGIYATVRGARKTFKNSADFVADTLAKDKSDDERLVPLETLPKVYDTIRRLASRGIDPANAAMAILQPQLQEGIDRDLNQRLSDPDYFNAIINDYRSRDVGTRFTDEATEKRGSGDNVPMKEYTEKAKQSNLVRQGRATFGSTK